MVNISTDAPTRNAGTSNGTKVSRTREDESMRGSESGNRKMPENPKRSSNVTVVSLLNVGGANMGRSIITRRLTIIVRLGRVSFGSGPMVRYLFQRNRKRGSTVPWMLSMAMGRICGEAMYCGKYI